MKDKFHWGYTTTVFVLAVAAMTMISVFSYTVEYDINQYEPALFFSGGVVAGVEVERATVTIVRGTGTSVSMQVDIKPADTAFSLLQTVASDYGMKLQTKKYEGLGIALEGIDDKVAGQDNKYWLFYINGEMAMNSIDNQPVKSGDNVEFRFEESIF